MRARLSALAVTLSLAFTASADAATLSVTTTGSDTAACTPAAPCKSFNAAYKKAAAGDVVEVAAGTYSGQSIAARTLTGAPVTIKAADGAAVTLTGSLDINTNNIVVQNFKADDLNVDSGGSTVLSDVTTIGIDAVTAYFQNTKNLVVKGGRLGGKNNKTPVYVGAWPMSYNVTFDGVVFHDATVTDSTVHTECLMVNDVQGMVIKNSTFTNCGYFGLMISHLMGELPPRDVLLENNVFETTYQWNGNPAPYSMLIGPIDGNNFVFRNNTFQSEPTFNGTTWSNGSKFVGNLGVLGTCQSGAAYSKNVWTGVTCGSSDKKSSTLATGFVDAANHDFRLKSTSPAVDAASTTDFPAADHDGNARPSGAAPDAGAFESGSTTPPPADTTPPDTTITAAPASSTTATTASFSFTATEAGSTFACRIDGGAWASCTSPKAYTGFALGAHSFEVRATDAAGNVDASPASASWTIVTPPDTTAPDTSISSAPASSTTATSASLAFASTEGGSTFECRIDGGAWAACTSPKAYSGLALGSHTFDVRATDAAGNTDASPASASWTIVTPPDTTAPDTSISSAPASSTTATSASLAFASTESGSSFECRIDGGAWAACTSPKAYSGLALGAHTFDVRATDAAGNTDASPASASWTIVTPPDTTAPDTSITLAPSSPTTSTSASFSFAATEAGSTFSCRLDAGSWGSCTSPKDYNNLAVGTHTFRVRATDAAGNTDTSPATTTWTVVLPPPDTTAPDTSVLTAPELSTTLTTATFTFGASEDGTTFQCSLDGAAWTACSGPVTFIDLAIGQHTFAVRAVDAAGNADATPATVTWTVVAPTPTDPTPTDPTPTDPTPTDPLPPITDPLPPVTDPLPPVTDPAPAPAPAPGNGKGNGKGGKTPKIATASLTTSTVCRVGTSKCPSQTTLNVASTDATSLSVTVAKRGAAKAAASAKARVSRSLKVGARSGGKATTRLSAKTLAPGTYTVTIVAQNGSARSSSCVLILTVR